MPRQNILLPSPKNKQKTKQKRNQIDKLWIVGVELSKKKTIALLNSTEIIHKLLSTSYETKWFASCTLCTYKLKQEARFLYWSVLDDLNLIGNLSDNQKITTAYNDEVEKTEYGHVCDKDVGQCPHQPAVGKNDVEKEDVVKDAPNDEDYGDDDEADGQCLHEFAVLEVDRVVCRIDASLIWQNRRWKICSSHYFPLNATIFTKRKIRVEQQKWFS